jgi:hypothetical protein
MSIISFILLLIQTCYSTIVEPFVLPKINGEIIKQLNNFPKDIRLETLGCGEAKIMEAIGDEITYI